MHTGDHNGSVRFENLSYVPLEDVLTALKIEWHSDEYVRKYPKVFLYSYVTCSFVRTPYNQAVFHLTMHNETPEGQRARFDVNMERSLSTGRPTVVYIR